MKMLWIGVFLVVAGLSMYAEEIDITFVGTVESAGDTLLVKVDEVLATAAEDICGTVEVKGDITGISAGDRVHVKGYYDVEGCVVTVETEDHFVYRLPAGAELEKLEQSIQFTGEITEIYENGDEVFCDILVKEVLMVTFKEKEVCTTVQVKIKPVVGEVEEGLQPGDEVEFSGTYDEETCKGSLGWHDDFLRKKKQLGVSWMLIFSGFVGYLVLRKACY